MSPSLTLKIEPATESVLDRLVEIQRASQERVKDSIGLTREDLAAMRSWPRIGPEGVQVIRDDERVVGFLRYVRFLDSLPPAVLSVVTVAPEYRDAGIADWAYERLLERARGDGATFLDTMTDSRDRDAQSFLDRRGFEQLVSIRTLEADTGSAPPEPPAVPMGFRLRYYLVGQDAPVIVDLYNRIFRQHMTFFPSSVEEMQSIEMLPGFNAALCFVLETDQGEPVAYARNTLRNEEHDAWIDILGVVPEYQGRGLGRYVLLQCMYLLAERHAGRIRLQVEGANERASALYDSVGFTEVRTRIRFRKRILA